MDRPGSLEFILMYTHSLGCTRMTSSLRGISLKIPEVTSRNWMRTSAFCSLRAIGLSEPNSTSGQQKYDGIPLPAFMMKGTPSHLSFLIYATRAQNVGQRESGGTVSSSLYEGLLPSRDFPYWPMITFFGSMESIARSTRTCEKEMST